jgi:hypothetical protein
LLVQLSSDVHIEHSTGETSGRVEVGHRTAPMFAANMIIILCLCRVMSQLRTRCDAHHKKPLCMGQERVVRSADRPSGTQLYIAHRDRTAWLGM